jgi:Holliday junction resolvase RusA-like endonuclease
MEFTIFGKIPSKKNSKRIIRVKWKPLIISSSDYLSWEKQFISEMFWKYEKINYPVRIEIIFHPWDRRKFDLSNKFESIADALVKVWILEDDNYSILSEIIMKVWEIKKGGETLVNITKL